MLATLILGAVLQTAIPGFSGGQPLTVAVEDVRDTRGHVRVELCTSDTFLGDRCEITAEAPAVKGVTNVTLTDVPAGVYAVQAYHDRNDNRSVDRNAIGLPVEGVGFSRHPPLGLHGPKFIRASFTHEDAPQTVTVRLQHFLP